MFQFQNTKAAERKQRFGIFGVLAGALSWIADNTPQAPQLVSLAGVQNGNNVTFTLPLVVVSGMLLFQNGILQYQGLNYTVNSTAVTFVAPPQAGDVIEVVLW